MKLKINNPKNFLIGIISALIFIFWTSYMLSISPGFLSVDSFMQLRQAISGIYMDWHPPLMAFIWRWMIEISSLTSSMLILQTTLFLLSLLFVIYYCIKNNFSKIEILSKALPLFLLSPFIINISGAIWKDVLFAFSLLLSSALALNIKENSKTISKYLSVLTIFILCYFALNIRINGFFAVLVILTGLFNIYLNKKIIAACILATLLCFSFKFVENAIDYKVLNTKKQNSQIFLMIDDIFAISKKENKNFLPKEMGVSLNTIQTCQMQFPVGSPFCKGISDNTWWDDNQSMYPLVKNAWIKTLKEHPISYLKFRLKTFIWFLGIPKFKPFMPYYFNIDTNEFSIVKKNNFFTNVVAKYLQIITTLLPFLYTPIFWVLVNMAIILKVIKLKQRSKTTKMIGTIAFSSIIYIFSYILIVPGPDYRYFYWPVVSAHLSTFLLYYEIKLFHRTGQ